MITSHNGQYKLVLVGDSAVGKSSILNRFVDDNFTQSLLSTIGVDFKFRKININGQDYKLQIWDTAGQQIFRAIVSAYYSSADAIIVVYDITSYQSFESLKEYWLKQIDNQNRADAKIFIIGNKLDMNQKRQVESFSVENLVTEAKICKSYQVSAKDGTGVQQCFTDITKRLIQQLNGGVTKTASQQKTKPIILNKAQNPPKSQGQPTPPKFKKPCCQT